GAIVAICRSRDTLTVAQEAVLLVGLLGGFTTYSTFAFHSAEMLSQGRFLNAAAYIVGTNLSGLAAVWAGLRLFGRAG
ncbi:MAG: fluoride efflux transporter FluC, partial [Planctomycetia bacterium]